MIVYYETPAYSVAHNPKVACTSTAKAIVEQYYPAVAEQLNSTNTAACWIFQCPISKTPDKPIVCLFRDPIERFKSAIMQTELSADIAIAYLQSNAPYPFPFRSKPQKLCENGHFRHQHLLLTKPSYIFKFPEQLATMLRFIGVEGVIPHLNARLTPKPTLQTEHLAFLREYYRLDIEIFEVLADHVRQSHLPLFRQ